jgi:glycogen operon protein
MLPPLVRGLLELRRRSHVFRRTTFFEGGPSAEGALADVSWFRPDGREMQPSDWAGAQTLQVFLSGTTITARGPRGETLTDQSFLLVLHVGADDVEITLPGRPWADCYVPVLDTADANLAGFPDAPGQQKVSSGESRLLRARSLQLLRAE